MADIGYGVAVAFGTFTGQIRNVPTAFSFSKDAPEMTHSTSPANTAASGTAASVGWREFLDGMLDAGELSLAINLDPDVEPCIVQAKATLTLTFPIPTGGSAGATWACDAICTGYDAAVPIDDVMTATVSWKLSGKPTFTASS